MRPKTILPLIFPALCAVAFADPGDPPARVARLNYISGAVSYRPGSVEEWVAATPNYPMTTGDHLWADEGAGAEMHIGSTSIRLAGQTALEFLNLDDRAAQLSVRQGAINIRLRHLDDDQTFEVDTPNGAVSLLRTGDYRIDVLPDENATYVTVRGGEAEVTGAGNPFTVHPREMARVSGDPASVDINGVRPADTWDQWCLERDRREDEAAAASARYVPHEMVGYEDLSTNGVWREMPGYGAVWAPRVAVGWAPYHYGHWAWVEPWGWTWIDDAPWGFAPFHYGRWAFAGGGWVWVPGAVVARPVYAPALVAFVGGPHFSLAVGVGGGAGVAWFPLGPHEVFVPSYHVSEVYVRQVNITHVTNITTVTNINVTNVRYVNRTVPGGVTAVSHEAFAGARPVAQSAVQVNQQELARAEVVHAAPVAPSRVSVLGRAPAGNVAQPPAAIRARAVVAKSTPPPAPVPFAARRQALQANPGHPVDPATLNNLRSTAPTPRATVRTIGQNGRPTPAPMPAGRPAQPPIPASERPNIVRPNVDRPATVTQRPMNPERPTNAGRPRQVETPQATPPARHEARSEARDERKIESKSKAQKKSTEKREP